MPHNSKVTAPAFDQTPSNVFDFNQTTSFIIVQNTDASINLRVGFSETDLLASGFRVEPGQSFPVPLNGQSGSLYLVSEGAELTETVILLRG